MGQESKLTPLFQMLEEEPIIRQRARENQQILRWPSLETVGVPTVKAVLLNVKAVYLVTDWWTLCQPEEACCIPIENIRQEVGLGLLN